MLSMNKLSLIGIVGAMGLSSGYGTVGSNEERFTVLFRALELGSTFWDTSDACTNLFSSQPIACVANRSQMPTTKTL
jgi:aryl-alcohol dehydrogenase-like predicted oxidoreductase